MSELVPGQGVPGQFVFALITETKLVRARDLLHLCRPLEENARHCAAAWGLVPPSVVLAEDRGKLPSYCRPIVFVDHEGDPGTLAVHFWDWGRGGPAGRVYCDRASGLHAGRYSICEAAAHEIVEALVDPQLRHWSDHPDPSRAGVMVAVEVADPVQDTYVIRHAGVDWPVTNYVTPAWFNAALWPEAARKRFLAESPYGFDHGRTLERPGQIGPEGYAVMRALGDDGWRYWDESRSAVSAARASAQHPMARSLQRRRGGQLFGAPA